MDGRSWAIPGVERLHHDLRFLRPSTPRASSGLQTHHGVDGYFPTDRSMACRRDFRTVMNARVIVEAATQGQNLLTAYVAERLHAAAGGVIDARDAGGAGRADDRRLPRGDGALLLVRSLTVDRAADLTGGGCPARSRCGPSATRPEIDFSLGMTRE